MKLFPKQQIFCEEYVANRGDWYRAALKVGYSKKTAVVIASKNLAKPYIKEYMETIAVTVWE